MQQYWMLAALPDQASCCAPPLHTTCRLLAVSGLAAALQMTTTAPWRHGILAGIQQRTLNSGAALFPQAAPILLGTHSIEPAWGVQRDVQLTGPTPQVRLPPGQEASHFELC